SQQMNGSGFSDSAFSRSRVIIVSTGEEKRQEPRILPGKHESAQLWRATRFPASWSADPYHGWLSIAEKGLSRKIHAGCSYPNWPSTDRFATPAALPANGEALSMEGSDAAQQYLDSAEAHHRFTSASPPLCRVLLRKRHLSSPEPGAGVREPARARLGADGHGQPGGCPHSGSAARGQLCGPRRPHPQACVRFPADDGL